MDIDFDQILSDLSASSDPQTRCLQHAVDVTGAERALLARYERKDVFVDHACGLDPEHAFTGGDVCATVIFRVGESQRFYVGHNALRDVKYQEKSKVVKGLRAVIALPAILLEQSVTVLYVDRLAYTGSFPKNARSQLERLAEILRDCIQKQ